MLFDVSKLNHCYKMIWNRLRKKKPEEKSPRESAPPTARRTKAVDALPDHQMIRKALENEDSKQGQNIEENDGSVVQSSTCLEQEINKAQ
jgi:hypothetical protein